ncbi:MAG: ribonuclease III domain-containing protein [Candidatus Aenigmatarchaeota archaeon]
MPDYEKEWEMAGVTGCLQQKIGYEFKNVEFITSVCFPWSDEDHKRFRRFEQIGDRVYTLAMAEEYHDRFPDMRGSDIGNNVSDIISNKYMDYTARVKRLDEYLLHFPTFNPHLADSVEALVGALYFDGGYEVAKKFVIDNFFPEENPLIRNENGQICSMPKGW